MKYELIYNLPKLVSCLLMRGRGKLISQNGQEGCKSGMFESQQF